MGDGLKGAASFQDISGHWAESYIKTIANMGIIGGKTSTRYAPNDDITRAELTKIAVNAFNIDLPSSVSSNPFKDVSSSAWYANYIKAAKDEGVVKGWGDNNFSPNAAISRVDALKILLEAAGVDTSGTITVSFTDTMKNAWYMKYVNFAKNEGIVKGYGDGTFGPANKITRAEVAKIVRRRAAEHILAADLRVDEDAQLVEVGLQIPREHEVQPVTLDPRVRGIQFAAAETARRARVAELRIHRLDDDRSTVFRIQHPVDDRRRCGGRTQHANEADKYRIAHLDPPGE
jgi:hypothetical protein